MPRSQPAKTMSSRLLTMKFMQRAAAASSSVPATPTGQDLPAESESSTPPAKRRRLSKDGSDAITPSRSDLRAISDAIKAEEEKRTAAIAKQASEAGETHWVLQFPAGTIQEKTSDAVPDTGDIDELEHEGRRSYGNYKRKSKAVKYTSIDDNQDRTEGSIDDDAALLIAQSREENSYKHGNPRSQDRSSKGISSGRHRQSGDNDDMRRIKSISGGNQKDKKPSGGKRKGFR